MGDLATWIGPQSPSDDATTRRHRFHQSWYRAFVIGVPAGTGPTASRDSVYGNMLPTGPAEAGKNFVLPEIKAYADERIEQGGTVEPFRCRHNMLSSQPMCFNLFAPLDTRPDVAAAFTEAVIGQPVDHAQVPTVMIEDSPGLLGDHTGLDASIRYTTSDGRRGILGIETKLTEQFSPQVYSLDSREEYRTYSTVDGSPFDPDRLDELTDARWNQLWRNQMLCEAIRAEEDFELAHQLVVHPEDAANTSELVAGYRELLTRPQAVQIMTVRDVVSLLGGAAADVDHGWIEALSVRYVELQHSQALYEAWRSDQPPFG